jgi:hypothetical protein
LPGVASPDLTEPRQAVAWLRTPDAVRERCHLVLDLCERGELAHFTIDLARIEATAGYVAEMTRRNYPDLNIPYHSRWRHFAAGGIDRWNALASRLRDETPDEMGRVRFDLAVVSVLLDAGAGDEWHYRESGTELVLQRSEGLAVASLQAFRAGLFSSDPHCKLRADASGLERIDHHALAEAFQVRADNRLAGLPGRATLLRNLAAALRRRPDLFGAGPPRIGRLFDHFRRLADGLQARTVLSTILEAFAAIWPGRIEIGRENLGDVWRHPAIRSGHLTAGLVPFHKLSQWLTYSLCEILEDAGITVEGLDELTGLAEYRNGGLFIDFGVLHLRDPALASAPVPIWHEAVVKWRALTLGLLDRIAGPVRRNLGRNETDMPLARILEGGTWPAARAIAHQLRKGGGPPLQIVSDGTVF